MEREGLGALRPLGDDVTAASWIVGAVRDFDHTVGSLVPPVFEAYARILHPAGGLDGRGREVEVSWARVAAANGRRAHAGMEWVAITGSLGFLHGGNQPGTWVSEPVEGSFPAAQAEVLRTVLAEFTGTAEECFFAVWEGFGALALNVVAQTVTMPQREMHLFTGPLSQAARVSMETPPWQQSPSLWWPADRRWCVATDVDLMSTYVGGTRECITAVVAAAGLEAWEVDETQSVTIDSDALNPLPPV